MNRKSVFAACGGTAAVLALSLAVSAQEPTEPQPPTQPPTQSPTQPPTQPPTEPPRQAEPPTRATTIIGCVQSEADFRSAKDIGRGGAAGTGVGAGNEFVIVNASIATASRGAPTEPPTAEAPVGTSGAATAAYEATGSGEDQLKQHVGKRVEITGTVKPAETAAGKPTGGVDPTGRDLQLPELEVMTVRATSGECPAK